MKTRRNDRPEHTTRTTTRIPRGMALVGPALAVAALSACSFQASASTSPDSKGSELAVNVQKELTTQNAGLQITGTTCKDTPVVDEGMKTDCTTSVDGKPTKLVVTWKSDKGDYSVASVD